MTKEKLKVSGDREQLNVLIDLLEKVRQDNSKILLLIQEIVDSAPPEGKTQLDLLTDILERASE